MLRWFWETRLKPGSENNLLYPRTEPQAIFLRAVALPFQESYDQSSLPRPRPCPSRARLQQQLLTALLATQPGLRGWGRNVNAHGSGANAPRAIVLINRS